MFPIALRKPSVVIPAIVLVAIAGAEMTPAAMQFTTLAASSATGFLSNLRHPGEPGLGGVVFAAAVLILFGVVSGLAGFAFSAIAACILKPREPTSCAKAASVIGSPKRKPDPLVRPL